MPLEYDLLLKGGRVIDPAQALDAVSDVAFKDGRVAAVAPDLSSESAARVIDGSGNLVIPGLIDIHGHYAFGLHPRDVDPDVVCTANGITTCVDAGSTGWINFRGLRRYVIDQVDTRVFAFVHLSAMGSVVTSVLPIPDMEDFRLAREEETIRCIQENRDVVLGVKIRLTPSGTTAANAVPAMEMARRICDQTGAKIMVHVMETPLPMAQLFRFLKPGDIATHAFHGDTHTILDPEGQLLPEALDAYNSGIVFDTGSAARHCSLEVSRAAVDQGMLPHTISTDRTVPRPNSFNYNLHQHMSTFLALGMPLAEVIRSVTSNPAAVVGRNDIGTLKPGAIGDAAVIALEDGDFRFEDGLGNNLRASRQFVPVLTVKDGKHWRPNL